MRAVLCESFGPPESLVVRDIEEPVAGSGEAVVRVEAAALNFMDTLIIQGKYQVRAEPPFSPAAELAGTVESVGEGVTSVKPGDRVMGFPGSGAAREKTAVDAKLLVKLPDEVTADQAAGLLVAYGTTYHALKDRARLQPGETLVVLGASGGVGLAAVELGKLMGARVVGCASSDDKLEIVREKGADEVINYATQDLRAELKRLTDGRGVDVVYDPVGGEFAEIGVRSLAWKGRFLVIGFAAGDIPKLPLNLTLLKGCDVLGVFWGRFTEEEPQASAENTRQLLAWTASGDLKMHLHGVYSFDRAGEALGALARREAKGKILLKP
ncbi:MAG: NADPH:quinone oxidoreductase family protein [Pseudomonadota bacterium]